MHAFFWLAIVISICYFVIDTVLIFSVLKIKHKAAEPKQIKSLSVVIAAKNESQNLQRFLKYILNQNHPHFEVIVVDDHSIDDSIKILSQYQQHFSNLKVLENTLPSSKKNAIKIGIEHSKHQQLIFTDADCKPLTKKWLSEIQHYFSENETLVLGYSPYKKEKGWLNKIIRFETCQTALNYFGMAGLGCAYMGVGRNLGYKKTVFESAGGFKKHQHLHSGDDDLLVNAVADKQSVTCCLNPKTFVESLPKRTFKAWIDQKRRHITTAPHYKFKHQLILSFQFISKFLFWFFVLPLCVFFIFQNQYILPVFVGFSLIIRFFISRPVFSKFLVRDLWTESFIMEFQLICIQFYIFSLNLITPKKYW